MSKIVLWYCIIEDVLENRILTLDFLSNRFPVSNKSPKNDFEFFFSNKQQFLIYYLYILVTIQIYFGFILVTTLWRKKIMILTNLKS